MNTLELRGNITTMLGSVTEKKQLKIVNDLLVSFLEDKEDWWDALPIEVQMRLDKALKETKESSKMKSHEDVMKKYEKWLS